MNSVLDDLENGEDLNELESRLYAQIHHGSPTQEILTPQSLESEVQSVNAAEVNRVVTNTSVINNVGESKLSNRYWNRSLHTKQIKPKKWPNYNPRNDTVLIKTVNQISKLKEKTFKPFQVYEPIISNLVDKTDNEPIVTTHKLSVNKNNGNESVKNNRKVAQMQSATAITNRSKKMQIKLKKQRQKDQNLHKQNLQQAANRKRNLNDIDEIHQKNINYRKTIIGLEKEDSLVRNYLKMQRVMKFDEKKKKSKVARHRNVPKSVKVKIYNLESISDDDGDDVIILPVEPPPIVTINDSSEDEEIAKNEDLDETTSKPEMCTSKTEVSFAKPKNVKALSKTVSNIADSNSSRCASPCSVISSDDFIGQADRSRLLDDRIIVNDDDLICVEDNVENYIENQQRCQLNVINDDVCYLTGQLNASNRKTPLKATDYRRTQDVYCESESDFPENNYSPSSIGVKSITSKPNIITEALSQTNSDCNQQHRITQKIKRLRKRRASSSNKEIEVNNDSTDSERDKITISNEMNTSITTLPFITRGEAVETCKFKKQLSSQSTFVDVNSSDNEFINMLQTFSQGKPTSSKIISLDHISDESAKSDEDFTARNIAEDILNKIASDSNVENLKSQDSNRIIKCNNDSDCAIPTSNMKLMEKEFDIIDKIPINQCNAKYDILSNEIEAEPTDLRASNSTNVIHTNSNIGWNEEMFRFYNCSWSGENFNVNLIREKMDRKARWTIYTEDRFPKYKKYSNIRCNNCSEMGHMQSKCPQSKKPLMCSMCGQTGHREPRCPNTICLRCGKKTRVFIKTCNACISQNRLICPICKIRGHGTDLCPDKWRRYHSTITSNALPSNKIIYNSKKFCCICAGRGHLSEHCKAAYRFSEYPTSLTEIKSHNKSYDDQKKPTKLLPNANSYNLLYEPDDSINFSFSSNSEITTKQYYGRFLNAVGLKIGQNKRTLPISFDNEIEKPKEKIRKTASIDNRKPQDTHKNIKYCNKNLVPNPLALCKKTIIKEVNNRGVESSIEMSGDTSINIANKTNSTEQSTPNSIQLEHNFKSPNVFKEKSLEFPEPPHLIKCDDISTEALNIDSDSNYSFSEHFDASLVTSTPATISHMTEKLPDFIPLNNNYNLDSDEIENEDNLRVLTDINPNTDDDTAEIENTFDLTDMPCVAKIYLKKEFSDYLLSPEGNKYLVNNSNKFDIKASIDWTRMGNILVLEGLRANQDKFHTELLLTFRSLPDKLNRKDIDNSQQVPRKRIKMIRFLSENLNFLQKNTFLSSDVNLLFKQLKDYENKNSQTSWKMAEKTRRTLNMILFGKIGLRDGKRNLDLLVNSLKSLLLISEQEFITNEMREDINKSWKYIFSSQKHENYEELVEIFYDMKRKNIFPNLKIDERLIDKNFLSLPQREKSEIISDCINYNTDSINNLKQSRQHNTNSLNDSNNFSKPISKLFLDTTEPVISKELNISLNISNTKYNNITQSFNEFLSQNLEKESNKLEWENQCIKLLKQMESCTKNSSIYWSKQSVKIINNCIFIFKSNHLLCVQLQKVLQKANKGLLSYDDHRDILKIYNNSRISENS